MVSYSNNTSDQLLKYTNRINKLHSLLLKKSVRSVRKRPAARCYESRSCPLTSLSGRSYESRSWGGITRPFLRVAAAPTRAGGAIAGSWRLKVPN